jgi:hypothetical protein
MKVEMVRMIRTCVRTKANTRTWSRDVRHTCHLIKTTLGRGLGHSDAFYVLEHVSSIKHYVFLCLPSTPSTLGIDIYKKHSVFILQFNFSLYRPTQLLPAAHPQSLSHTRSQPPTLFTKMSSIESISTFGTSPAPSTALTHTYPPAPAPTPNSTPSSTSLADSPILELTLFSQQENPFRRHGAEILHLDTRAAPNLSTGQKVRLGDGELYKLEEVRKVSRKWVVFRCDPCNEQGELVRRRTSVLFAVEPGFVRRKFWNRLGRAWFEARPSFLCIR